jgi:hypothetical protein
MFLTGIATLRSNPKVVLPERFREVYQAIRAERLAEIGDPEAMLE